MKLGIGLLVSFLCIVLAVASIEITGIKLDIQNLQTELDSQRKQFIYVEQKIEDHLSDHFVEHRWMERKK